MRSLDTAFDIVRGALLAERGIHGHWEGELSTSALSTATAVMSLIQVRRQSSGRDHETLISAGLDWLISQQHADGGWGDTSLSHSNISTTMLCRATLVAAREFVANLADRGRLGTGAE
ncbi:MAG: squalene--hopene cyclase, partial [Planctomycetaceae bacterium]